MNKKYLSIKEAAEYMGVSALTLRNWDKTGKFSPSRHPMNNYRVYDKDELDELYKKLSVKPKVIPKGKVYSLRVKHLRD
jgi:excisionase family DNA binding protein